MIGDLLDVHVEGESELSRTYAVGGDGSISVPLVGRVPVLEKTIDAAEQALRTALDSRYFKKSAVTIQVAEYVEGAAYIQGAVGTAGPVETKGDHPVTLMEALARCGGVADDAAADQVRIYRWKPGAGFHRDVITVNVREMLSSMDFSHDQYLRPRDLVVVPRLGTGEGGGDFLALGEVSRPGFHAAPDGMDVIRAVTSAGGLSDRGRMDAARLLRPDKNGQYKVIPLNLHRLFGLADMSINLPVRPGDILFVPSTQNASGGQVIFLGALNKTGGLPLPLDQQATLARSIMSLGGFTKFADQDKVKVIRTAPDGSKQTMVTDVERILKNGDFDKDLPLRDGDVVIVPERSW